MSRVLDSLSKLEKKDTRITFYSAPQYPDLESSNVHLSPLSTEQSCDVDSISITQGVFPFHSLHIQSLHSHSLPSSSGQENLAAFQSLQSIDPPAPLSSLRFLLPHKHGRIRLLFGSLFSLQLFLPRLLPKRRGGRLASVPLSHQ